MPSQRSSDQVEALQSVFDDLHSGWLLQCAEHLANLFKGKQITPGVRGRGGTLVRTLGVSLHRGLSWLFEGRFLYNNSLNQSLSRLSLGIIPPPCWPSGNDIISPIRRSLD